MVKCGTTYLRDVIRWKPVKEGPMESTMNCAKEPVIRLVWMVEEKLVRVVEAMGRWCERLVWVGVK